MFQSTPQQIDEWANAMLDEATDEMCEQDITVNPDILSAYFTKEYGLPLNSTEAVGWLREQEWYHG